jgi:hypothetical protein
MAGSIDIPGEPESFEYQVRLSLYRINQTLDSQNRTLDKLDHAINGNGKRGLIDRTRDIEIFVATAKEDRRNIKRIFWYIAGPIIGLIATGTVTAIIYLIRIIPQ